MLWRFFLLGLVLTGVQVGTPLSVAGTRSRTTPRLSCWNWSMRGQVTVAQPLIANSRVRAGFSLDRTHDVVFGLMNNTSAR